MFIEGIEDVDITFSCGVQPPHLLETVNVMEINNDPYSMHNNISQRTRDEIER